MEYLSLIGTVAMLNLLAAMSPGPDFVMAVRNSLSYSRRTGILTGIGIGLGISIHIFYCAAGIGYIIRNSPLIFNIIRYLGAAYLAWMGVTAILSRSATMEIDSGEKLNDIPGLQAIKTGFLTNILNPKATLFFLGLFALVIKPETPRIVLVLLAFIMVFTAIGWFTIVAIFFTQKRIRSSFSRIEKYFNKFFGALLVLLAFKIVFSFREPV